MSQESMLAEVRSQLGYTERGDGTTKYGDWFAERHGGAYRTGDWCAMGQLWCAWQSGNLDAVGGDQKEWAYVPSWWNHFRSIGRSGSGPRAGALVFFDFNRTGDPEHVGICTGHGSGVVHTIEFNTDDAVRERDRSPADVLGYGYPDYPPGDLRTAADLGALAPQTAKAGGRASLSFEVEYQDPDRIHADAQGGERYPSLFPKGGEAVYGVTLELILAARPDPGVQVTVAEYARDQNTLVRDVRGIELDGARSVLHSNIRMSDAHKYRFDLLNDSARDVMVERAYALLTV